MLSYRVYDTKQKRWVKDNIYLSPNNELFEIKKSMFGKTKKFNLLSQDRYVYHNDIELYDKNNNLVYIGDYVKAQVEENKFVIGVVTYAHEMSAYIILCVDSNEYFTLGLEVCDLIEVVGNVFNGYEVVQDGKQALSNAEE